MTRIEDIIHLEQCLARAVADNKVGCIAYFGKALNDARRQIDVGATSWADGVPVCGGAT